MSKSELERMTRRYASEILPIIGPSQEFRAGRLHRRADHGVDYGHLCHDVGHSAHGVVTGKPVSIGVPKDVARPQRAACSTSSKKLASSKKISLRGASVAIQGFGNAGATAAAFSPRRKQKSSP